ncbi:MAG TPA: class I SAM-dependent methyltransferase [Candidatus Sulfotelmatobacter sp.]|nr:class I SAM-dependent methyltransferase [Candidatus Sulfotelmatobacter sp.]
MSDKAASSAKDAFDVALVPGARTALREVYSRLRNAEEDFYAEMAGKSSEGALARVRACPLCGEDKPTAFLAARGLEIVRCASCAHVYSRNVYTEDLDLWQYEVADRALWTAYLEVKEHPVLVGAEARRNKYFVDICERYTRRGRMLEVGSGNGGLLYEAAQREWVVDGIDPNPIWQNVQPSMGIKPRLGWFPKDLGPSERFDAISMLDVLEHMVEPVGFLKSTRPYLAPDGILFLQVPNLDSLWTRLRGAADHNWCPSHWSYFDAAAMARAAECAGYEILWTETVITELDRILAMEPAEVLALANELGHASLSRLSEVTPAWIHAHKLGYKLISVLRPRA